MSVVFCLIFCSCKAFHLGGDLTVLKGPPRGVAGLGLGLGLGLGRRLDRAPGASERRGRV
jgi:hypothetical protein